VAGDIIIDGAKRQIRPLTMAVGAPVALANGIIQVKSITRTVHLDHVASFIVNANHSLM
jgi:hypothetical protein